MIRNRETAVPSDVCAANELNRRQDAVAEKRLGLKVKHHRGGAA